MKLATPWICSIACLTALLAYSHFANKRESRLISQIATLESNLADLKAALPSRKGVITPNQRSATHKPETSKQGEVQQQVPLRPPSKQLLKKALANYSESENRIRAFEEAMPQIDRRYGRLFQKLASFGLLPHDLEQLRLLLAESKADADEEILRRVANSKDGGPPPSFDRSFATEREYEMIREQFGLPVANEYKQFIQVAPFQAHIEPIEKSLANLGIPMSEKQSNAMLQAYAEAFAESRHDSSQSIENKLFSKAATILSESQLLQYAEAVHLQ